MDSSGWTITFLCLALKLHSVASLVIPKPNLSKHPVLIVVSFDGFRFDYMSKVDTPNLNNLVDNGVTVPYMTAQFPTYTFPNHQSIATGLIPDIHGVTDNTLYDPFLNKTLSGFGDDSQFWNYHPDITPIWIQNEQGGKERYSGCYMWPGSSQGYGLNGSLFPKYHIPWGDRAVPWEVRVDTAISWITDPNYPANMVFLYYSEPDSKGHAYGPDSPEMLDEIRSTDDRTGYLVSKLEEAKVFEHVNLIILSDHGMMTVPKKNIINVTEMLEGKVDKSTYRIYGSSPLYQFNAKDDTIELLEGVFTEYTNSNPNFRAVYNHVAAATGLRYGKNRRVMDLLLIAGAGYAFDDVTIKLNPITEVTGIHGYDSLVTNMRAFFVARGPLFHTNRILPEPFENIDLFPLFCEIMGIDCTPNNGTLRVVKLSLMTSSEGGEEHDNGNGNDQGSSCSFTNSSLNLLVIVYCLLYIN